MPDPQNRTDRGRPADNYDGPTDGYDGPSTGYGGPSSGCDPAYPYDGPSQYDGRTDETPTPPGGSSQSR
ncbi:MAG TPA: hypothetical protein VF376_01895 [Thermoanaerobaculia bacterium]